jgi:hypothetical protein
MGISPHYTNAMLKHEQFNLCHYLHMIYLNIFYLHMSSEFAYSCEFK